MSLLLRTLPLLAGGMLTIGVFASPAPRVGVLAAPAPTATPAAVDGFVMNVSGTDLVAQLADGSEHTYHLAGTALPITRNGQKSSLAALQQGDQITLTLGPSGAVVAVDAAGPASPSEPTAPQPSPPPATAAPARHALGGILAAASDQRLTVQFADGSRRDFHPATQVHVTRNGTATALTALQAGDAVTITTGATNRVTALVATGAPSQARTVTVADAAGIVVPPLALLVVAVGSLWYRRARPESER